MLNCKFTSILLRSSFSKINRKTEMQIIAYFEAIDAFCIFEFVSLTALIASMT